MPKRQRRLRRWLIGYVAVLLGTLPMALTWWNAILKDSVGQFVTVEQIHLAQYAGLGTFVGLYVRADARPRRTLWVLGGLLAAVGLTDECVQWILPGRFFEWSDVGLNLAGGVIGVTFAATTDWMIQRARQLRSRSLTLFDRNVSKTS